ncbi:hypothetical protein [Fodinicola acaciae]|uniref:hypothetical protein n=1 Tax=Fodinicola acaciae TaxID=2681555 RepID=UPI0013D423C6|nr:hypothetical protein [Fodinicola acaciae]
MRFLASWPKWTACAALASSLAYLGLGIFWTAGGGGFPFGATADAPETLLKAATGPTAGPWIAAVGLVGAAAAMAMICRIRSLRWPVIGCGLLLALTLTLVLPEDRAIKYLPPLGLFAFLRPPDWPTVHHLILILVGFLWLAATVAYWRAMRNACESCGRTGDSRWERWWLRWGRVITYVAIASPWVYASERLAWAAGIPLGVTPEFLRHINAANPGNGTTIMELVLAGFAISGSVLTAGLIRPWGVNFFGWRVPRAFPIVFGGLVSVSLTAFGVALLREVPAFFAGGMMFYGFQTNVLFELPALSLPVWGIALGGAVYAYHIRTRPQCRRACVAASEESPHPVSL